MAYFWIKELKGLLEVEDCFKVMVNQTKGKSDTM